MTTFENIFDLEGAMERAAIHVLGKDVANVYHEFSDADKKTPGYEVQFDAAQSSEGLVKIWRGLRLERAWRGRLSIKIVTQRKKNSDLHLPMLVHARLQCMSWRVTFNNDSALPYHQLTFLQSAPVTRGHVEEQFHDWTELHFDVVLAVREDAWPAE